MDWNRHDSSRRAGEIDLDPPDLQLNRGVVKAVLIGVSALVLVLIVLGSMAYQAPVSPPATSSTLGSGSVSESSSPASGPAYAPLAPTPAEWAAVSAEGERVDVARVIDGDTFVTGDGDHVRVLGIDSCEAGTPGGREATERAEYLLSAEVVTLIREPGVDRDRYDRALRYVSFDRDVRLGGDVSLTDFGRSMVTARHTGVYEGRNDASPEYLAELREADQVSGRDCSGQPVSNYVAPHFESDDDGESRFCRRRWWC